MPVFRAGGIQLRISYSIIFAGLLLLLALTSSSIPARVFGIGVCFWISGWLAQSVSFLFSTHLIGKSSPGLCLGVLGVESGPRCWLPRHDLVVSLASLIAVVGLGVVYCALAGGLHLPQVVRPGQSIWSIPSLGFADHDSIWMSAACLCWLQALFQLYPLPRTLGRQIIGALIAITSPRLELAGRVRRFRHWLVAGALFMMGLTLASMTDAFAPFSVHWIIPFALSLILWISSRGADIELTMEGYRIAVAAHCDPPAATDDSNQSVVDRTVTSLWSALHLRYGRWRMLRRLKTIRAREQGEAVDERRLDEILSRLQRDGMQSLSGEDRRVLNRVSVNLRKRRDQ